jgi:hypothetical protein
MYTRFSKPSNGNVRVNVLGSDQSSRASPAPLDPAGRKQWLRRKSFHALVKRLAFRSKNTLGNKDLGKGAYKPSPNRVCPLIYEECVDCGKPGVSWKTLVLF